MTLLLLAIVGALEVKNDFGTGADYSSERYVVAHEDTAHHLLTGADTLDYETEARVFWDVQADAAGADAAFRGSNELDLTTRSLRDRLNLGFDDSLVRRLSLSAADETEGRAYHSLFPALSDTALDRSYLATTNQLSLRVGVDSATSLALSDALELLGYERPDTVNADYLLNRLELSGRRELGLLSSVGASYRWSRRLSRDRPYGEQDAELDLDVYPDAGPHFELDDDLARRRFADVEGSYWQDQPELSFDFDLSDRVSLDVTDQALLVLYDSPTPVYVNTIENDAQFEAEVRSGAGFSWRAGFEVDLGRSLPREAGDDYREPALLTGFEWLRSDRLSLSVDDRLGSRRHLAADSLFGSDYLFNEFMLTADWTVLSGRAGALKLEALASLAPEWHARRADNSAARIGSLALTYRF